MKSKVEFMNERGSQKIGALDKIESPVDYAFSLWQQFQNETERKARAKKGQFLTPPEIAKFMASFIEPNSSTILKILDPGSGTGILTAAIVEQIAQQSTIKTVEFDLYENDQQLLPYLKKSISFMKEWLSARNVLSNYNIHNKDFVIDNASVFESVIPLDGSIPPQFDIVIMNPPYFKFRKSDKKAQIAAGIVHGQPNIYFIFLMLGALLLKNQGQLISISPRSFTSGSYFKAFRNEFFKLMHPSTVHLFTSRTRTFKASDVLQETVILDSHKARESNYTTISSCVGLKDLDERMKLEVTTSDILRTNDGQVLFLPTTPNEFRIMKEIEKWPETLTSLGLRISTGPVVPFRATDFLLESPNSIRCVPLLWMHNIQPMEVTWPLEINKPQYIEIRGRSARLLLPNSPYIILHRFSAKEQLRRFTAAPLVPDQFSEKLIGIENHLNYIHRPDGSLDYNETIGLAAILNTKFLDTYIRIRSGSTQINASDMQFLPLPSLSEISRIGSKIRKDSRMDLDSIESFVVSALDLGHLIEM